MPVLSMQSCPGATAAPNPSHETGLFFHFSDISAVGYARRANSDTQAIADGSTPRTTIGAAPRDPGRSPLTPSVTWPRLEARRAARSSCRSRRRSSARIRCEASGVGDDRFRESAQLKPVSSPILAGRCARSMRTPEGLQPLLDDGIVDEVVRQLKSGKEASVYVVRCGAEIRCAKVYKNMAQRSFQQRSVYQEGRKVRGSRQMRAMSKSTRYGRKEQEEAWKNAEVDALYRLVSVGVRVPQPLWFLQRRVADGNGHRRGRRFGAATGRDRIVIAAGARVSCAS